ncbi:MAG TPA: FAD binding domain-containing protein [Stellaceae bacterium]|nr:FAD binding domain-containing protein [Stellaceae bacterium]
MKPAAFDYLAAASLEEAVAALAAGRGEARLLAGGQTLGPMLNLRLASPKRLVDVGRIASLRRIADNGARLVIGSGVTHAMLEDRSDPSPTVRLMCQVAASIAYRAVRNRGTLGGSLAHADPAAELPLLALLLEARITAVSTQGRRVIAAADFFTAALTTALAPDEILTEIELPGLPAESGWGFAELARRAGDFALAAVGAIIAEESGVCRTARIAMAGVGPTPLRAPAAEALLRGGTLDTSAIAAAARAAAAAAQPADDLHASAAYRRHLVEVLTRRALSAAVARARKAAP